MKILKIQDEELGEGESERKWEAEEVERRERRDYNYQEEEYMERREAEWEERDSYRERWEGWTYPESDWREEYYYGHYGYQRWREDYPDTNHQRRWSYDSYYDKVRLRLGLSVLLLIVFRTIRE